MNIVIYDDNINDTLLLKDYISEFMKSLNIDFNIYSVNDSIELIEKIQDIDILFLDIELKDINGIDLGMKIKSIKRSCKIIITSLYQKYLIDGYKIGAERYFLKPINKKHFFIEMKTIINDYFFYEYGILDSKISNQKIYLHDIMYIEYFDRHSILHCVDQKNYTTPYSLKYWEEKLGGLDFVQCYKSILVNCQFIDYVEKTDVILINDEHLPISRHYKKDLENKYIESVAKKL